MTATIFNTFKTQKGAENYIAKHLANVSGIRIENINGRFFVVA